MCICQQCDWHMYMKLTLQSQRWTSSARHWPFLSCPIQSAVDTALVTLVCIASIGNGLNQHTRFTCSPGLTDFSIIVLRFTQVADIKGLFFLLPSVLFIVASVPWVPYSLLTHSLVRAHAPPGVWLTSQIVKLMWTFIHTPLCVHWPPCPIWWISGRKMTGSYDGWFIFSAF